MNKILRQTNIIDVTLRDGGYRNNFNFSMDYILQHINLLQKAGIDFFEIGYRNGSILPIENIGITGIGSNEYIKAINDNIPNAKLVIIAHADNISEKDIKEMHENGITILRFCINIKNVEKTLKLSKYAKNLGLITSLNIVRISNIDETSLIKIVSLLDKNKQYVDIVYFADSNGNLNPDVTKNILNTISNNTKIPIGFHAHDNLGLALSNAIIAVENGTKFIDASLLGMGKGIGNLKLEQWIAYNLSNRNANYSLPLILTAISKLENNESYVDQSGDEYIVDMMCGSLNLPFTEREKAEHILLQNLAEFNKISNLNKLNELNELME